MFNSAYNPPLYFKNGHVQTIYPVLFRQVDHAYRRERIVTPDNDFLDLDWSCHGSDRLVIVSHGLEGNSDRAYVKGMVKAVTENGWDALAWNYRSCSGESNRLLRFYHNGATDDLSCVIDHVKTKTNYTRIALVGFSLGGNLTLNYLGNHGPDSLVSGAVVFSVPCDLKGSAAVLKKWPNQIYMQRFFKMLHQKIKAKMKQFPGRIDDCGYNRIKDFKGFDDRYTAPIHGFKDAEAYWAQCSSKPVIPHIKVPTLIINAQDDPFLSRSCFPVDEAAANRHVTLSIPKYGGHVGFIDLNPDNRYWSEQAATHFLNREA